MSKPRSSREIVDGWLLLDKPVGLTSTHAVSRVKRLFNAKKAGHAGTLDPLASGVLPIAFGEATKTVPFVQEGEKAYRFTVSWGVETNTDDAEGEAVAHAEKRPSKNEILQALPNFIGQILQQPPVFSALKINGERAYDLARDGETVILAPRPVFISRLDLVEDNQDFAIFETWCGKGTYVRALARDLGRMLGCFGHVSALRRTRVGPFFESDAVCLSDMEEEQTAPCSDYLLSVEAGLAELPCVIVDRPGAARLRRGQSLLLRGRDAPIDGCAYAACSGVVIATGEIVNGALTPARVFNLPY